MKRAAPSSSLDKDEESDATITHRTVSERMEDKARFEKHQLYWARHWAKKAEYLDEPISIGCYLAHYPLALPKSPAAAINPVVLAKYKAMNNSIPLNGDTIAAILKQTKPHCPKAQAWIKAHEYSKEAKKRLEARIRERERCRKHQLEAMRWLTFHTLKTSNASREEVQEILTQLPPASACEIIGETEDDKLDHAAQMVSVLKASREVHRMCIG